MNLVLMLKFFFICVRICFKFSVKCEASHKVDFFFKCLSPSNRESLHLRQVLHLTITVCRKLQDKVYTRKMVPIMGRASS